MGLFHTQCDLRLMILPLFSLLLPCLPLSLAVSNNPQVRVQEKGFVLLLFSGADATTTLNEPEHELSPTLTM